MMNYFLHSPKQFLMLLLFTSLTALVQGQNKVNYANKYDHNHYSIEVAGTHSVMAGTLFDPATGNTSVHVMKIGDNGAILWEKKYDFGGNERCLDVCMGPQNKIAITGHVDGQLFVVEMDGGGSLIAKKVLQSPSSSIGLSILYSTSELSYYVAGYTSNLGVLSAATPKTGLLIKLDQSLNPSWSKEIKNGNSVLPSDLTEIGTHGVVVTGKIYQDPMLIEYDGLRVMYSHGGTKRWDRSTVTTEYIGFPSPHWDPINSTVADAVYEEPNDILYLVTNVDHSHTFVLERMNGVSGATPSIAYMANNDASFRLDNSNVAGFAVEINPYNGHILVAGLIANQPSNNPGNTDDSPAFLAELSPVNGSVLWFNYWRVNSAHFNTHDIDALQAFYTTHPYVSHPDILAIMGPDKFRLVGYEDGDGVNDYDLNMIETDQFGDALHALSCQANTFVGTEDEPQYVYYGTYDETPEITFANLANNESNVAHNFRFPCTLSQTCPTDVVNYITWTSLGCYQWSATLNVTVPSGSTIVQVIWDWGDGKVTTTPGITSTHTFQNNKCMYPVCVTVLIMGSGCSPCVDLYCENAYLWLDPGCTPCTFKKGAATATGVNEESSLENTFKVFPNPASNQLTVEFDEPQNQGTVFLMTLSGQKLQEIQLHGEQQINLEISDLSAGTYLLQITSSGIRSNRLIQVE